MVTQSFSPLRLARVTGVEVKHAVACSLAPDKLNHGLTTFDSIGDFRQRAQHDLD